MKKAPNIMKKSTEYNEGSTEDNGISTEYNGTRRFTKRNWVAFMLVNISELEKGYGELYMAHGNLNITMVYLR